MACNAVIPRAEIARFMDRCWAADFDDGNRRSMLHPISVLERNGRQEGMHEHLDGLHKSPRSTPVWPRSWQTDIPQAQHQ